MYIYKTFLSPLIEGFIAYREATGFWNSSAEYELLSFERYCVDNFPNAATLTQEMIDSWYRKHNHLSNATQRNGIIVISKLIEYLRSRGKTDVVRPPLPKRGRRKYIPHAFTQDELKQFFLNCDTLPDIPISLRTKIRRITVPVFFRLMYSSGLRCCEARQLRVEDVDLAEGTLNVRHSKGPDQHYVALHDTMLELMKKFDEDMQILQPNRKYFFQSAYTGKPLSDGWIANNFRQMWGEHSDAKARPYDLRHNYAVENINQWIGEGYDFSKFVYLSKSMGHREFESTKYYFHLVPAFADILDELSGQTFNDMIPEVNYAEI